jgi:hypothetical protein
VSAPVDRAAKVARLAKLDQMEAERRRSAPTHWGPADEERAREADALRAELAGSSVSAPVDVLTVSIWSDRYGWSASASAEGHHASKFARALRVKDTFCSRESGAYPVTVASFNMMTRALNPRNESAERRFVKFIAAARNLGFAIVERPMNKDFTMTVDDALAACGVKP